MIYYLKSDWKRFKLIDLKYQFHKPRFNHNLERINAVRNPRIVKLPMR